MTRVRVVCDHGVIDATSEEHRLLYMLEKLTDDDGTAWAFVTEPGASWTLPGNARDRTGRRTPTAALSCPDCGRAPRANLRRLAPALDRLVAAGLDHVTLAVLDRYQ